MGKRGPRPVHMGMLNMWEFEFYKAFHLLRDGLELPYSRYEKLRWVNRAINGARLEELRKMNDVQYLQQDTQTIPGLSAKEVREIVKNPANLEWAKRERTREVGWLERQVQPRKFDDLAERRTIWNDLWRARTLPALRNACDQWKRLPLMRTGFPAADYILANASQFFRMKRDGRFPESPAADDSRLEYLARGMAGVLEEVSPMTAIERLRNMKHVKGGPLWDEKEQKCKCWRCGQRQWDRVFDALNESYKGGLRP